jgi:Putative adhesin
MQRSRSILQVKKSVFAYALTALVLPWLAHAATAVDEHRPANPQGAVEIDNVAGSIELQGWDKSEVAVTGTVGKDVERVDVTSDGNRTSVRVVLPQGHHWGSQDGSARLSIHVPTGSSISASMVSSDLKISAIRGGLELRTVSGNIRGEGGGDVHANSVSGDIHFDVQSAKLIEVKTISGDIVLTGKTAEIEATTVSGTAHLTLGTVSRARFKTISGNITAALAAAPDAQMEGESVSGDIKLEFASTPEADFDIQTISGDIDNCFGPKPNESRHGPGARLSFKTGNSGARVHISTRSGDVRLCVKK